MADMVKTFKKNKGRWFWIIERREKKHKKHAKSCCRLVEILENVVVHLEGVRGDSIISISRALSRCQICIKLGNKSGLKEMILKFKNRRHWIKVIWFGFKPVIDDVAMWRQMRVCPITCRIPNRPVRILGAFGGGGQNPGRWFLNH